MNAASISIPDTNIIVTDNAQDSDSDASSDGTPDYYQPISSHAADDDDNDNDNDYHPPDSILSNGHYHPAVDNVLRSVDRIQVAEEDDEEGEEQELRRRAEADTAIRTAFLEDDTRRNAPLPSLNAARVMEAMRGVSLSGFAPDWANHISEDRWLDHLHHIPHPPTSSSSTH